MIIDSLSNTTSYNNLHPLFEQAFEYIKSTDLLATEPGKYQIAEGLTAIITDKKGITAEESAAKFECHRKNIDIQLCIRGDEQLWWKPLADCHDPRSEYNEEKDVLFFNDQPDTLFGLKDGQFSIFFPQDVHAAMIGEGEIKKLVVKVRI